MRDISELNRDAQTGEALPSTQSLLKATAIAFTAGAALLVTTILPAEYGIDPTGVGGKLGLTALSSANAAEAESDAPSLGGNLLGTALTPVWKSDMAYRSDEMSLTLMPKQGAEIKAKMKAGERFIFNWRIEGGVVNVDMHGEPLGATEEFTSYWLARNKDSASGAFEAPIDGTHGWYWRNDGDQPVTVKLATSGFYETLYRP